MSTPGYPAYYYGDSQTGSMSNLSEGGGGMRRYASKSSVAGGHSLAGSRLVYVLNFDYFWHSDLIHYLTQKQFYSL